MPVADRKLSHAVNSFFFATTGRLPADSRSLYVVYVSTMALWRAFTRSTLYVLVAGVESTPSTVGARTKYCRKFSLVTASATTAARE